MSCAGVGGWAEIRDWGVIASEYGIYLGGDEGALKWSVVMTAQFCENTKSKNRIIHFEWVNYKFCMACEIFLSKSIF